ncbi:hypothetical protein RB195_022159 [Necator americanus]
MLKELNKVGKRIGLRINRKKSQFMENAFGEDGGVQLDSSQIVETSSQVHLRHSMNMENDLKKELNRRMRAAWTALVPAREAKDERTNVSVPISLSHFFQRSNTQRRRGQTLLPRLGNYSLPTEPLRDVF